MKSIKKIYFVGIKGVGMVGIAIIAKEAGFFVRGSDAAEEFLTDETLEKAGITPLVGFDKKNIEEFLGQGNADEMLVITTSAHEGMDNPEVVYALEKGITVWTHGRAVGEFMKGTIFGKKDMKGISVAGSHGKTTITALVATCLEKLGANPSYAIGTSEIFPLGLPAHFGSGQYFVAEADEYVSEINYDKTAKLLYQHPFAAIINNIDFDHPDFYQDITAVENVFERFIDNIQSPGILLLNADDSRLMKLAKYNNSGVRLITYGSSQDADFRIIKYTQDELASYFSVSSHEMYIGDFRISLPGYHNAKNSLAVIALLLELGYSLAKIQDVLPEFQGTKRRLEHIGTTSEGTIVIDDYAHHPEEIKKSLQALKTAYPSKKIVCIFQPHTHSRTEALMQDFAQSFYDANSLIFLPVFASARDIESGKSVSYEELFKQFQKINKEAFFLKNAQNVLEYIDKNVSGGNTVVVTMGAGDVYEIGYQYLKDKS